LITIYPDPETRETWEAFKAIAKRDGYRSASDLARKIIADYVKAHLGSNDQFILTKWSDERTANDTFALPTIGEVLTVERRGKWSDDELVQVAKAVKGRKQELEAELKRRGYWWEW
jgi:hypothetical protein